MENEILERLIDLSDKASDLVVEMVDALEFVTSTFLTQEEFDNGEDCIYDAPCYIEYGKYGSYDEYAIMKIEKGGTITCIGRGDNDSIIKRDLGNLSNSEVIELCKSLN